MWEGSRGLCGMSCVARLCWWCGVGVVCCCGVDLAVLVGCCVRACGCVVQLGVPYVRGALVVERFFV